jgi:hypothetical protein
MDHRLFAVLAIICFALGGAGCASESAIANREEIMMPLQTGSVIQRRVMVEKEGATKKPKKKKKKEKDEKKEKEAKRTSPTPTPAPEVTEPSPPKPEPESTAPPDRYR